ncbi:MAG: hypothetical protein HDQ88_12400 [Clostridia bacterium]|nr:hypothetical protein [Clostridia bacterium]
MIDTVKANEGVVSSIGDTDLVMCSGSDGGYTPISFANLAKLIRSTINAGGRNLALGTSEEPTVVAGNTKQFRLSETLSIGEEVSVSFELDYPSPQPYFEVYISPLNGGSVSQRHMIQRQILSNGLNKLTFTLTKVGERIAFYTQAGVSISVSKVMVTRGNMFSDWAPAPEDSWGGVIGYLPINYNLDKKGGAHDGHDNVDCAAEGGADGHLSFRSLGALTQFIGRACEDGCNDDSAKLYDVCGSERHEGLADNKNRHSLKTCRERSGEGLWIDSDKFWLLSHHTEGWRRRKDILQGPYGKYRLATVENSLDGDSIDRKEVAYV